MSASVVRSIQSASLYCLMVDSQDVRGADREAELWLCALLFKVTV